MDPTDIAAMIANAVAPLRDEIEALRSDLNLLTRRLDDIENQV